MSFALCFTDEARKTLQELKHSPHLLKRYKAVVKSLRFLSENPRHPGLQTHKYYGIKGPGGEEIFDAYAEQDTPAAYRIFFYYGPKKMEITVIAVTPHP